MNIWGLLEVMLPTLYGNVFLTNVYHRKITWKEKQSIWVDLTLTAELFDRLPTGVEIFQTQLYQIFIWQIMRVG
jgi:hypothetical protein